MWSLPHLKQLLTLSVEFSEGIEHQLQPNAARAVPANNRLRSQDEDYPLRRRRTNDPRYIN